MSTAKCDIVDRNCAFSAGLVAAFGTSVTAVKDLHALFLADQTCMELRGMAEPGALMATFQHLIADRGALWYSVKVLWLLNKVVVFGMNVAVGGDRRSDLAVEDLNNSSPHRDL
jgi:hypothetical protein